MVRIIWLIINIPIAILFTALGVYAWRRKKPMWFESGREVKESEISDIPAYNRANGIMWLCFSAVFWVSSVLGIFETDISAFVLAGGIIIGIPAMYVIYKKIYNKYKTQ